MLAGHYQIVRHLSIGEFSQTYIAKDCDVPGNGLCVVKRFQPQVRDLAILKAAKQLFEREAEVLYRLGSHDQIPRMLAHFEQKNEFFLVQELIEGHPLSEELIPGKKLNETEAIALLQSILHVLDFVHTRQIIHRNIKPAHLIRRSDDGNIVLVDFGAIKEVATQSAWLTGHKTLAVVGSPGYMPSEQQAANPQFSSDIYAVGMIGIQAVSGIDPLDLPQDSRHSEILFKNVTRVSPSLAEILERMVHYDYHQRYQNAKEVLAALHSLTRLTANPQKAPNNNTQYLLSVELANQDVRINRLEQKFSNLPKDLHERLHELLVNEIGPIGLVMLKQALIQAVSWQDLVERLIQDLSTEKRSQLRSQLNLLQPQQKSLPLAQNQHLSSALTPISNQIIDSEFIKRCELELAKAIGPIASLFVRRTLVTKPNLSKIQLIETLAQYIPCPELSQIFYQAMQS